MSTPNAKLTERYSGPGPRYTSYPTVPVWRPLGSDSVDAALQECDLSRGLSLYFHLPFCESRCAYCGCSVVIAKKRSVAERYVDTLILEMESILRRNPTLENALVEQIHWGGGTPTFLPVEQIERLGRETKRLFKIDPEVEASVEIDPRVTSREQLERLRALGFNRLSLGVQDFDPAVQEVITRIQSEEQTRTILETARRLGFKSVNFDLIYGLPLQSVDSFRKTVSAVVSMRPDRIALFSYAHVPWISAHQRSFSEADLPSDATKREIFDRAREDLLAAGYHHLGLDHFVLQDDELYREAMTGGLHRNFQGYTTKADLIMLGFGVTAISDLGNHYSQNHKKLAEYYRRVEASGSATERGVRLSSADLLRRTVISSLMCRLSVDAAAIEQRFGVTFSTEFAREIDRLRQFEDDGLLHINDSGVEVTETGQAFIRNICMVFDQYLPALGGEALFSSTA